MKKAWTLLLAGMLMLTACSSNSSNQEGSSNAGGTDSGSATKEISIWAWDPSFNIAALEIAKTAYADDNPDAKVNVIEYAQNDIIQKLNTGLNSGTTKGLPNIVLIEDYRAQSFLQAYPDMFVDLSSNINAGDFADYKIGPTSHDGKQYGVPFDSGVTGLYVRTDYLEQAGYSVEDLQDITWNEYIEIGKAVKEKTGKNMISLDPNDLGILRMMVQSAGSWVLKEDGTTPNLADNAALKEAFEVYKAMMENNIVRMHSDWSQFVAGFNSGEVASVPTGNWITPSIKAEASQAGQWAIAPLPVLANQPDSVHASNLGGSSWYVLNVPGSETAADFLAKTFGSDVEMYQKLLTDIGALGTLKEAAAGTAYEKSDEFFGGQNIVADFAKWTEQIPNVNYGMHTYAIEDILIVEMQNYLNGKDLDKALADAQAQAEAQLK
ncbi:ABC transporter substrate-binding protein [Paenibacillus sambharensis]|uniref:ABC transporter substrate-binding protein n=1 Tax=Paenibacillus sambharensis TaxID=1803190 RepID=A0A2W1LBY4_9BACL|nr:ABC transporter substrate-binding protein [Paenibacillus sambharensis]PZD96676.1 ABC transporter substrate-binding protein [Paenibacillus sambharensis]